MEIHYLDISPSLDRKINKIHPLAKLIVTLWYLILVISVPKYEITDALLLSIYPIAIISMNRLPFMRSIKNLWPIIAVLMLIGLANPILDRNNIAEIGTLQISGGFISMITLFVKGLLTFSASFILIYTTPIEEICYSLRLIKVPTVIVTTVMLIYRYLIFMLKELERIGTSYSLRAPNQKGIQYKAWGSLVGSFLLRSIDRAQIVFESMTLRGFQGEFHLKGSKAFGYDSLVFVLFWILLTATVYL